MNYIFKKPNLDMVFKNIFSLLAKNDIFYIKVLLSIISICG
jgi:hypothetical protein